MLENANALKQQVTNGPAAFLQTAGDAPRCATRQADRQLLQVIADSAVPSTSSIATAALSPQSASLQPNASASTASTSNAPHKRSRAAKTDDGEPARKRSHELPGTATANGPRKPSKAATSKSKVTPEPVLPAAAPTSASSQSTSTAAAGVNTESPSTPPENVPHTPEVKEAIPAPEYPTGDPPTLVLDAEDAPEPLYEAVKEEAPHEPSADAPVATSTLDVAHSTEPADTTSAALEAPSSRTAELNLPMPYEEKQLLTEAIKQQPGLVLILFSLTSSFTCIVFYSCCISLI